MTYNVHHGTDAGGRSTPDQIGDFLVGCDADVVCLQELDRHWGPRSGTDDQPGVLAVRLAAYLAFGPTVVAPGPPAGPPREYGNAILSRHPLTAVRTLAYPTEPRVEARGSLSAEVTLDGVRLRCVVTHLAHRGRARRQQQARFLREDLATASQIRTVLAGDLNCQPHEPAFRTLQAFGVDAWAAAGVGPGGTTGSRPRRRIDHVLAGPGVVPVRAARPRLRLSDHFPLVVDLRLS